MRRNYYKGKSVNEKSKLGIIIVVDIFWTNRFIKFWLLKRVLFELVLFIINGLILYAFIATLSFTVHF